MVENALTRSVLWRVAAAPTVPRPLLALVVLVSIGGGLLADAAAGSAWTIALVVLLPWLPVIIATAIWVHRHFRWLVLLYLLVVAHLGAVLVGFFVADGIEGSTGVYALLLVGSTTLVSVLFKLALDRSADVWLARGFPHAPREVLVDATRRASSLRFRPGAVVIAEGDRSDHFYIVTAGAAEVTQLTANGEMHINTHERGECFGEVGLLTSVPRSATVRAVSTLDVLALDEPAFHLLLARSGSTADELASLAKGRSIRSDPREDAVPMPPWTRLVQRMFKHPRAMHYNRLIAAVLAINAVIAVYGVARGGWWADDGTNLHSIAIVAQANVAFAIVVRQQYVINALAWLATRARPTWPLRLRWALGKYYHFGGLHVGGAVAGTMWYLALVGSLTYDSARGVNNVSPANLVVSYVIVALFIVMVVMATPRLRAAQHDRFEVTHRFCGWAALVLVWVNTVLFVISQRGDDPLGRSLLTAPTIWILVATTVCAAWPWLLLRKVPIVIERPSTHAVIVKLDHGVKPGIGTTRPISRHPLVGWHHFANVPAIAGSSGYRMVISRAGDWTSEFIDDPPPQIWVRGIPTMGVANVRRLFKKVVLVATGSGIGPMLGHLLDTTVPSRLVWVTRNPRRTYGDELVGEIEAAQPDAIIWDTDERGKPDVLRLAYAAYLSSDAEAVICIANRTVTWQVVNGLERRGIPAFGPIWDS